MSSGIALPFFDEIHQLAVDIVNASAEGDTKALWSNYQALRKLCENNEFSPRNHPFQWEALADFTCDLNQALKIYRKALRYANEKNLVDYSASITFAMANRLYDDGERDAARELLMEADKLAQSTNDLELRREISALLLACCE
ncbi:tetratricopeptide repeat protein [Hahella sp. HN01]|uniref:tetratricopeptide repeat protein n=1 Tax=Hahella sp. HN01 TaxID=2847262 RepID=UPI001C1F03D6|nr:tetratricopeptide repeat protein [Hahella sp. HN01]MBU6952452.1 tetratricopeptide repeat protein [Hahella sp. HN01]